MTKPVLTYTQLLELNSSLEVYEKEINLKFQEQISQLSQNIFISKKAELQQKRWSNKISFAQKKIDNSQKKINNKFKIFFNFLTKLINSR